MCTSSFGVDEQILNSPNTSLARQDLIHKIMSRVPDHNFELLRWYLKLDAKKLEVSWKTFLGKMGKERKNRKEEGNACHKLLMQYGM